MTIAGNGLPRCEAAGDFLTSPGLEFLLPKLIQRAMKMDTDAAIEAFGKNELAKKVFWTFFIGMAGRVLPATARQVVGLISGTWG